jgi:CRISPR/Cas system-associated exonuclease Cas4 (RecB family)
MMRFFQLGHIIHEWIQGQYVRAGLVDESGIEYPIKDEAHRVTGHIDLWLEREKRVIDIKTASWSSFSKYEIPKYEHRVQTSIYADQVGAEEIEIRYVCKDGGGLDMFLDGLSPAELEELEICATGVDDPMRLAERVTRFKPEPELATQAYEKFARIERSIERGVPPTPEYSPTTRFSPCKSCEFRYACRDLTGRDHPDIGTDEFDLERWIGSSS